MKYRNILGIASLGLSAACGNVGSVSPDKASINQADCFNCWPDGLTNKFMTAINANGVNGGANGGTAFIKASRVQITVNNQQKDYVIIRTYDKASAVCGASPAPDGIAYLEGSVLHGEDCNSLGTKKGTNWAQDGQIYIYGSYNSGTQTYPGGAVLIGGAASTDGNGITSYPLKNPDNSSVCTNGSGTNTNAYLVGAYVSGTAGSGLELNGLNLSDTTDTDNSKLGFSIVCKGNPTYQYLAKCVEDGYISGAAMGSGTGYNDADERFKKNELLRACTLAELADYNTYKSAGTFFGTAYTRHELSDGKDTSGDDTSEAIWTSTGAWCINHTRYVNGVSGITNPDGSDVRRTKFKGPNPDNANTLTEYSCPSDWSALSDYKKYLRYHSESLAADSYDWSNYKPIVRSLPNLVDSGSGARNGHILPGSSGESDKWKKKYDNLSTSELKDRIAFARYKEFMNSWWSWAALKTDMGDYFYSSDPTEFEDRLKKARLTHIVGQYMDCPDSNGYVSPLDWCYKDTLHNLRQVSDIKNWSGSTYSGYSGSNGYDRITYADLLTKAAARFRVSAENRAAHYCSWWDWYYYSGSWHYENAMVHNYGVSLQSICGSGGSFTSFSNWVSTNNSSCSNWDDPVDGTNSSCRGWRDFVGGGTYPMKRRDNGWSDPYFRIPTWSGGPAQDFSTYAADNYTSNSSTYSVSSADDFWKKQLETILVGWESSYPIPSLTTYTSEQNLPTAAPFYDWTLTTKSLRCRTSSGQTSC